MLTSVSLVPGTGVNPEQLLPDASKNVVVSTMFWNVVLDVVILAVDDWLPVLAVLVQRLTFVQFCRSLAIANGSLVAVTIGLTPSSRAMSR